MDLLFEQRSKVSIGFLAYNKNHKAFWNKGKTNITIVKWVTINFNTNFNEQKFELFFILFL